MKRAMKYISFLPMIIILVTCKSNPVESSKYYVAGYLYYSLNDGHIVSLGSIPINIDEKLSWTDAAGRFYFNEISEGSHIIRVSSPSYQLYENTIKVVSDTSLYIRLYTITSEDYFPINENSHIKFRYEDYSYSGLGNWYKNGEALWNVHSSTVVGDTRIYSVEEILTYTSSSTLIGDIPKSDTVTTFFEISESSSHTIGINSAIFLSGVTFDRYLDSRGGDIISRTYGYGGANSVTVSFKKYVGIYYISQDRFRGWTRYYLIE